MHSNFVYILILFIYYFLADSVLNMSHLKRCLFKELFGIHKLRSISTRMCGTVQQEPLVLVQPWSQDNTSITKITMNNPKKRNCLSSEMMLLLTDAINNVSNDNNTRVIVINGNGPVFSSGRDLKELLMYSKENNEIELRNIFNICTNLMLTIQNSKLPIIAMPHGMASAVGLQLICACDIVVSTKDILLSTPGVNIGLFCSTPSIELSRNIGKKLAMEMLLTGEPINGERAYEVGLINYMANNNDEMYSITEDVCNKIISKSKPVISLGKEGFYNQIETDLINAHNIAGNCMVNNLFIEDCQEGIESFISKRKPKWNHKYNQKGYINI